MRKILCVILSALVLASCSQPPAKPASNVCGRGFAGGKTKVNLVNTPELCVVWLDEYDNELGFRVALEYLINGQGGETFTFETGPNITELIVPPDMRPTTETFEACMRRKDFNLSVTVLLPDGETTVGGTAGMGEC